MTAPVFADVDTGVDDAFALVYLLASPDAELIGIACTGGNVAVDQVVRNNLGLLQLCRVTHVPVSRGADQPLRAPLRTAANTHGPAGLGYAELPMTTRQPTRYDAAEAWIRAAREHSGELIGLVTGPLTNLALAVRAEPALPGLLRRLVIMGGRSNTAATPLRSPSRTPGSTRRPPQRSTPPGDWPLERKQLPPNIFRSYADSTSPRLCC